MSRIGHTNNHRSIPIAFHVFALCHFLQYFDLYQSERMIFSGIVTGEPNSSIRRPTKPQDPNETSVDLVDDRHQDKKRQNVNIWCSMDNRIDYHYLDLVILRFHICFWIKTTTPIISSAKEEYMEVGAIMCASFLTSKHTATCHRSWC